MLILFLAGIDAEMIDTLPALATADIKAMRCPEAAYTGCNVPEVGRSLLT